MPAARAAFKAIRQDIEAGGAGEWTLGASQAHLAPLLSAWEIRFYAMRTVCFGAYFHYFSNG